MSEMKKTQNIMRINSRSIPGNSKAWGFLIIRLLDIPFGLVKQCDENEHESWKALIDKY